MDDDRDRQTLCQLAEEINAIADKRWKVGIERQMASFEEMIKGLVDSQVRGAQIRNSDPESRGEEKEKSLVVNNRVG